MDKKRGDCTRCIDKKAQVTIFIIIGIIVLFAFIFLIQLTSTVSKDQLSQAQEGIIGKVFKKEGLRLFVEDCLSDSLEQGLVQLGQQGTFWDDQPGGTKTFEEFKTGVPFPASQRTLYGLVKEEYEEHENAYPCDTNEDDPEFCQYTYPNNSVGFGKRPAISAQTIKADLARFLKNRTIFCVENYTKTNISSRAEITSTQLDLKVSLEDQGLQVNAHYPLKLRLGNEEFFHLSTFDFFYPSKFKQFIDTAITFPLQWDYRYVDFEFNHDTLTQDTFTYGREETGRNCEDVENEDYFLCQKNTFADMYRGLDVETKISQLGSGDDVFTFTTPLTNIINIQESDTVYTFRLARQNRPPALDYISRLACPDAGWDYLVIPGDQELGEIDITANAIDPDEDEPTITISQVDSNPYNEDHTGARFYTSAGAIQRMVPGYYTIDAMATDIFLTDEQQVRVLIDRPMTVSAKITSPYMLFEGEDIVPYNQKFSQDRFMISVEDPVFIDVEIPIESQTDAIEFTTTLNYESPVEPFEPLPLPPAISLQDAQLCYSFPWGAPTFTPTCEIDAYDTQVRGREVIEHWDTFLENPIAAGLPSERNYFKYETDEAKIILDFSATYCALHEKQATTQIDVVVKQCIPHQNPQHPYAYPFHTYKFTPEGEFLTKMSETSAINPFLATHSCCNIDGSVKASGETCFTNPEPNCYGGIQGFTLQEGLTPRGGLVVEEQIATCDGTRGNICNGGREYRLWEGDLRCGDSSMNQCGSIPTQCQNQQAFSYLQDEEGTPLGWCHGNMGCKEFCPRDGTNAVVDLQGLAGSRNMFAQNHDAKTKQLTNDEDLGFVCGCNDRRARKGMACDSNFDGQFKGECTQAKVCEGDG